MEEQLGCGVVDRFRRPPGGPISDRARPPRHMRSQLRGRVSPAQPQLLRLPAVVRFYNSPNIGRPLPQFLLRQVPGARGLAGLGEAGYESDHNDRIADPTPEDQLLIEIGYHHRGSLWVVGLDDLLCAGRLGALRADNRGAAPARPTSLAAMPRSPRLMAAISFFFAFMMPGSQG